MFGDFRHRDLQVEAPFPVRRPSGFSPLSTKGLKSQTPPGPSCGDFRPHLAIFNPSEGKK